MKSHRWLWPIMLVCLVTAPVAHAALGGNAQSVQADQASMGAARSSAVQMFAAVQGAYTSQSLTLPSGTVVHEYITAGGVVFAVTWQGSTMPDLQQILGSYMSGVADAVKAYRLQHPGIGPVSLSTDNVVIEAGGHMGDYVGRAYLPSALPAGVALSDIQ